MNGRIPVFSYNPADTTVLIPGNDGPSGPAAKKPVNKEGHSLGMGYNRAEPAIDFPKGNTSPSYGKKKVAARVHGGDQYGTTLCKSEPAVQFPNSPAGFAGNSMIGTQKSEG